MVKKAKFQNRENKAAATPPSMAPFETLAEISSIDGSFWKLCLHPLDFKRDRNPDLEPLLKNSGSTNPFFNPAFLMASRDRMVRNQIHQLIVWEGVGKEATPKLSIPMTYFPKTVLTPGHWKTVTHPFAPLGDPLIHKADKEEITSRFFTLLDAAFNEDFPPIVLGHVSQNSPFYENCVDNKNLEFDVFEYDLGSRSSINRFDTSAQFKLSKKRNREFNRLLNRLNEFGETRFERVSNPFEVLLSFEEFLLLETRGWKGRNGTSIHAIKRDAAFARQSVSDLSREGKCEIFTLRLDKKPIAAIILFKINGGYFPWKITFDATYEKYSPGSQLMYRLTQSICSREDFIFADSLAVFGRSWMSSLWPDTLSFRRLIWAKKALDAEAIERSLEVKTNAKQFIKRILRYTH